MFENQDFFIPLIWEGDGHNSPNYATRYSAYNVMALPSSAFDGETFDLGGGAGVLGRYQTIYNNRINLPSPMEIDVSMNITRENVDITADVLVTENIPADSYRIIYILTNYFDPSYHSTVVRYYEESYNLLNQGATGQFNHSFAVDPSWDLANIRAVVLVQHVNTTGVFTVTGYPQYPFNKYPILQGGIATYPLVAPDPITNIELELNSTEMFDLTNYFYYQGSPVLADLSVESSDPSIVEAVLNGNILSLNSFSSGGNVQISIYGSYAGYNAVSNFNVYVVNPLDHYIVIWDLDPTPTGATLQSSLQNFYTMGEVHLTNDISAYPLTSNTDAVFVLLGIYSSNHVLTAGEAALLAAYLDNGGNVYMEGGDTWYYDTQTVVHPYFNINATGDGSADLSAVVGQDFLSGMNWTYSGENNWIDRLTPIAPAVTVFQNQAVGYDCGIAYNAGTYKTVGASFEITGLGGTNTLDDAISGIIDFFGIGGTAPAFDPPTNLAVNEDSGLFTWDAPSGSLGWLENFDSYTAGQYLAVQSDDWTTWSNAPGGSEDGYVVNENSYSASNSLKVQGSTTDLVHEFGSFTSGVYEVSLQMYVASGYGGYYNLLHFFNGASSEWGLEAYFGSTGSGFIHAAGSNAATFNYPVATWFEAKCIIDLDNDWAEYYVNGNFVYEWQWSIDSVGNPGSNTFGAIDIYAAAPTGDAVMFYIDDINMTVQNSARELTGYNVYLDGVLQGNTAETEWLFADLIHGITYTAGVEAVYDDGISELVTIDFTYLGTNAGNDLITKTELKGNYPNPFNPETTISFATLDGNNRTEITIYNLKGQKIKTLLNEVLPAGRHSVLWNGTDESGKKVASGVYFYKMKSGSFSSTRKMILMK
jgi:hypothetical protein